MMFLATATPFYKSIKDIIGVDLLIWSMAKHELETYLDDNEAEGVKLIALKEAGSELPKSPLRLTAPDPSLLVAVVNSQKDLIHTQVVAKFKPVLETIMLRRLVRRRGIVVERGAGGTRKEALYLFDTDCH